MKKRFVLLFALLALSSFALFAQGPPPPPHNAGSGTGPVGGSPSGAPVDGAAWVFLALAGSYGILKVGKLRKPGGC